MAESSAKNLRVKYEVTCTTRYTRTVIVDADAKATAREIVAEVQQIPDWDAEWGPVLDAPEEYSFKVIEEADNRRVHGVVRHDEVS